MGHLHIRMFGLRDQNVSWQVIVVIEQHMSFDSAFNGFEVRPRKQTQAQRNRRRVQRQQFVLEAKTMLACDQQLRAAKSIQRGPEEFFKQRRRTLAIGIRQRRLIRRAGNAKVNELAKATTQAVAYITQRSRMRQLTKQHGHKLCPARESLCPTLGSVFADKRGEFGSRKMLQQLIEQTRDRYHGSALLGKVGLRRRREEVTMHRQV